MTIPTDKERVVELRPEEVIAGLRRIHESCRVFRRADLLDAIALIERLQSDRDVLFGIAEKRGVEVDRLTALVPKSLDTDSEVFFYEQEFYVLSNFSSFTLEWEGRHFDTSEAAYHWEKFPKSPNVRRLIQFAASAHEAFKIAEENRAKRRDDWDGVKVGIMRRILHAKAEQHEYVRRKLMETGSRTLIENSWRDDYWGWGPNRDGQNMLGKLWMEVRAFLPSPPDPVTEGESK